MRAKVFDVWRHSIFWEDDILTEMCEVALGSRMGDQIAAQEAVVNHIESAQCSLE